MIAADTSTLIALFAGEKGKDVDRAKQEMQNKTLLLPPAVLTELLSAPNAEKIEPLLISLPIIEITDGFFIRAGLLRRTLLRRGRKAGLGDVLIAQSCLDAKISLITRDSDFSAIAKICALEIA